MNSFYINHNLVAMFHLFKLNYTSNSHYNLTQRLFVNWTSHVMQINARSTFTISYNYTYLYTYIYIVTWLYYLVWYVSHGCFVRSFSDMSCSWGSRSISTSTLVNLYTTSCTQLSIYIYVHVYMILKLHNWSYRTYRLLIDKYIYFGSI